MTPPAPDRPAVLVYRDELLPYSETFIATQCRAMRAYRPILVGTRHALSGMALDGLAVEQVRRYRNRYVDMFRLDGPPFSAKDTARLRRHEPELVHAHFGPDGVAALPLARALSVPLVVTFHGYDATRSSGVLDAPGQWRYQHRLPRLGRRATHLIAVSDHIRRRLVACGLDEHRITTQYIGVDTTVFTPPVGRPREANLIVAVGRMVEKKGFAELLDAFGPVLETLGSARLVLLGDGPLRPRLTESARRWGPSVEFHGPVAPAEVRAWLQRATVLAVPSVTAADGDAEGLPTVVLEGMACGVPIVATDHAGIPEAVVAGVTGELVPERDVSALAGSLIGLMQNADRRATYAAQGRARAVSMFDVVKCTAQLEDLYRSVTPRSRG